MSRPRVCIVCPATARANNGNWRTASRWSRFLRPVARVSVLNQWQGETADVLIALHARRSAPSVQRFREQHPDAPVGLVLTGTDLYHDWPAGDASTAASIAQADRLVVLQPAALSMLPPPLQAKTRVIVQSAPAIVLPQRPHDTVDFVAVGHLRVEKDPLTLMAAARLLQSEPALRVIHIGAALDPALGDAAQATAQACPNYRWVGPMSAHATRRRIAQADAFVHMSRLEGGANVVIEALRSQVPVLASRIDGNVGLLGPDHAGYFEAGDAAALAEQMRRVAHDPRYAGQLRAQSVKLSPRYAPARECAAVRHWVAELLAHRPALPQSSPRIAVEA